MIKLIIAILLLAGSFFVFTASLGLIRFRDLYSRLHASTKATSFGLMLLIAGIAIYFNSGIIALKGLLILIFIYGTAPLASHAIGKSFLEGEEKKKNS